MVIEPSIRRATTRLACRSPGHARFSGQCPRPRPRWMSRVVPRLGAGKGQPHRRAHRLQRRARPTDRDPVRDPSRSRSRRARDHARVGGLRESGDRCCRRERPSGPGMGAIRAGGGRRAGRRRPARDRPDGHDRVRSPAESGPLVVRRSRGGARARPLRGRRRRARAARARPPLPTGRAAGRRRPVRHPRPGGVPARIQGARDPARLPFARIPADPRPLRRRAPDRRLRRPAESREHRLRGAAKRAGGGAAARGRRSLHRGRHRCARRARRRPEAPATARRHRERARAPVRGGLRGRRPRRRRRAPPRESRRASATTTRSRSRSSTCWSSSRSTRALSAPACSAAGSAGPCSSSRTTQQLEEVGRRDRGPVPGTHGNRRRHADRPRLARRERQPTRLAAPARLVRCEDVREAVVAAIQPVPRVGIGSARGRAEPSLRVVEAEHGRLPGLQVARVSRLVEIRRGEVARREGDHRHALDVESEAVLVGERETPDVAVPPVLLGEDVRHVLVGDGAPEGADDRRGETIGVVLPRAAAEPLEPVEPRQEQSTTPIRGRSRRSAPRRTSFSTSSAPGRSMRKRCRWTASSHRPRPDAVCTTSTVPGAVRIDSRRCSRRSSPSSSQRPSTPRLRSGSSRSPSLSVAARHSCSTGPVWTTFRPPAPESTASLPVAVSTTARVPWLSRAIALSVSTGRARETGRARGGRRDGSAQLLPRHLVTGRRPRGRAPQEEAEGDEPLAAAGGPEVEADVARPACGHVERRKPAATLDRTVDRQLPRPSQVAEVGEVPPVVDPEPAAPRASTETGRETNFSSYSPGWGVRSGHTRPSAQKLASCGVSPKSPPYFQ